MNNSFKPDIRIRGKEDTVYKGKTGRIIGEGYIQVKPTVTSRGQKSLYFEKRIHIWRVMWDNSEKEELVDEDQLEVL